MYGLDLGRSKQETLSDIYYRIYYLLCSCVGRALIAGKITVQVNADATRAHFGGVVGGRFWCADSAQILYVPYGVNVLGPWCGFCAD